MSTVETVRGGRCLGAGPDADELPRVSPIRALGSAVGRLARRASRPRAARRTRGSGSSPGPRQMGPRTLGLWSPSVEPGDALEVRLEDDRSPRARPPADERVQLQLVFQRLAAGPEIAVVDDHERNPGPLADLDEERQVRLAAALDDRDLLASASWPSAWKTNGRVIFSVIPSTRIAAREKKSSERSASNSHMTRNASSTSIGRSRSTAVTPSSSRVTRLTSSSAATLSRPGRVRGEEDLVAALGEPSDEPAEIAVRVRGEEQLRLLDREDDARGLGRAGLEPADEGDARRRRARERLADRRVHGLRGRRAARRRHEVAAAKRGREVDDRRRAGAVVERDRATVGERRLDRELALAEGYVGRREVEARVEQGTEGEEHVRLAGARLADERADRAGPKHRVGARCGS